MEQREHVWTEVLVGFLELIKGGEWDRTGVIRIAVNISKPNWQTEKSLKEALGGGVRVLDVGRDLKKDVGNMLDHALPFFWVIMFYPQTNTNLHVGRPFQTFLSQH